MLEKKNVNQRRTVFMATGSVIIVLLFFAALTFRSQAQQNDEIVRTARSAGTFAAAQQATAEELQRQADLARTQQALPLGTAKGGQLDMILARRLAAQAQLLNTTRSSQQLTATLLAIQSMKLFPSSEAAQFLLDNNFAAPLVSERMYGSAEGGTRVVFSPGGKYIALNSDADAVTIRIQETASGKELARLMHDEFVNSVVFSPDGKYLASASSDSTARMWEVATGREVARVTFDDVAVSVAFTPDGRYVLSGSHGYISVWEPLTGKEVARIDIGGVFWFTFSPDGRYVVLIVRDGSSFSVWETGTWKKLSEMIHNNWVNDFAFTPDGEYIVSGSWDGTARVWIVMTGEEVVCMQHEEIVFTVDFSPDGRYVVTGTQSGIVRVWEVASGKEVSRVTHDGSLVSVAFSPDGRYVASGGEDFTARVWEAATGQEVAHMSHDDVVRAVIFSQDGKSLTTWAGYGPQIREWKIAVGRDIARLTYEKSVTPAAFSPDGKYAGSANGDDSVESWPWQPDDLIADSCKYLPRNLTRAEWKQYIGDALPYQAVCSNLPPEPEVTATP